MLNYALRVNLTIAIVEMIYDDNDNQTAVNITHGPHNVTEVRFIAFVCVLLFIDLLLWNYLNQRPSSRLPKTIQKNVEGLNFC